MSETNEFPDIKYWSKIKEVEIMREGPLPYFCLNTLWEVTKFDYENGMKRVTEWRPYWYSLN